jgi:hypothetical protein
MSGAPSTPAASARKPRQGPDSRFTVPRPSGGGTCARSGPIRPPGSPRPRLRWRGAHQARAVAQGVQPVSGLGPVRAEEAAAQGSHLTVERQAGHMRANAEQDDLAFGRTCGGQWRRGRLVRGAQAQPGGVVQGAAHRAEPYLHEGQPDQGDPRRPAIPSEARGHGQGGEIQQVHEVGVGAAAAVRRDGLGGQIVQRGDAGGGGDCQQVEAGGGCRASGFPSTTARRAEVRSATQAPS